MKPPRSLHSLPPEGALSGFGRPGATEMDAVPKPEIVKPQIADYRRHVLVCTGPRCTADGQSQALFDSLGEKFKAAGIQEGELRVKRSRVSCFAACKGGPILCVQPDGVWYYNVTPDNMDRIVSEHLVRGEVVDELVFHRGPTSGSQATGIGLD